MPSTKIEPQDCPCGQAATAAVPAAAVYVFGLGRIRASVSSLVIGAELQQANWLNDAATGAALQYLILSQPRNLYIARNMCWILQINAAQAIQNGTPIDTFVDSYVLLPQTNVEMSTLISALHPLSSPTDVRYTIVQGIQGPLANPSMCNGLQLPTVLVSSIKNWTRSAFISQIQVAANVDTLDHAALLFDQMLQASGNTGNTAEYRAVNWLAVAGFDVFPSVIALQGFYVYKVLAAMQGFTPAGTSPFSMPGSYQFTGVSTSVETGGTRMIVGVVLHFSEINTGAVVNWFCQVDATTEFPFLVRPFTRYYSNP
jgi:hypothetical protein